MTLSSGITASDWLNYAEFFVFGVAGLAVSLLGLYLTRRWQKSDSDSAWQRQAEEIRERAERQADAELQRLVSLVADRDLTIASRDRTIAELNRELRGPRPGLEVDDADD